MTNSGRRLSIAAKRLGVAVGLTLSLALPAACARQHNTAVARGEYYAAGHPDYDEFFVRLYRYQHEAAEAGKREQGARSELARTLGVPEDAKPAEFKTKLRQRSAELGASGVQLTLVTGKPAPAPAAELLVSGQPEEQQQATIAGLKSSALALAELERSARASLADIDQLRVQCIELERAADEAFRTQGIVKQTEVKSNLGDARKLLLLMSDQRSAQAQGSSALLAALAQAFPPKAVEAPVEVAEEPTSKRKKKRSRPAPSGKAPARSAATPAKPAPKPAPKPAAPKADFEP